MRREQLRLLAPLAHPMMNRPASAFSLVNGGRTTGVDFFTGLASSARRGFER